MQEKKVFTIVAIALVATATLGAVYIFILNNGTPTGTGATVTDSLGRTVPIPEQIDSIYCIGAGSLRLVSYFNVSEKVLAIEPTGTFNTRDDQTYYLINKPNYSAIPQVATTPEAILALAPDLIITSLGGGDPATADTLQAQTNVSVYVVNVDLEFGDAFYAQITSLGTLFGEPARAVQLNEGIISMIHDITATATTGSDIRAYACGMFYYGGASFLKGSGNYLPFDYSNITNAMIPAANGQPYTITLETLIAANPAYIFIDSIGLNSSIIAINDFIEASTGLDNVTAIKDNHLYSTMIYKCYGTNWENQLVNVYYVASIVNGHLYSWTFEDKANEILQLFYPGTTMTYSEIAAAQTGNGCSVVTL